MTRERNSVVAMLGSLGWPLIWGLAGCTLFYASHYQGWLGSDFVRRYFAAHPVCFFATGMFFVGLAALLLKMINVAGQFLMLSSIGLDADRSGTMPVSQCGELLDQLDELPRSARRSYYGQRLRDAVEHIERRGSADTLEDELKYLADMDVARQQDSYALVRIIIWATPMLGFLGTVIGITQALGDLDPKMLATEIQTAMEGLLAGLYVAFDTTALALSLSIILMFIQFLIDRAESELLAVVDHRMNEELAGRFETMGSTRDPHLAAVQRMAQEVIQSSDKLVTRQSQLWQQAIEAAHQQWDRSATESAEQLRGALSEVLDRSLERFADRLASAEQESAEQARQRWEQWQTVLSNNARMLQAQQQELVKLGDVMTRAVEATGEVVRLETALNSNLNSLAGAHNFEETVMSLAAAIHLLSSRLGATEQPVRRIDLEQPLSQGRAA